MNALILLLVALVWFAFGYFIYSKFLEGKLFGKKGKEGISDKHLTPAHKFEKDNDYKPTKKEILFGHHFASIAGAGPIIGPILAVSYFGWLFVMLWITLGTVIIGAVHDYTALLLSVKNDGKGIAKVSEKVTNKKTFYIFSIIIWLTMMLIITVFSVSSADSLMQVPALVIPFFGITITAVLLGLMIYKLKWNKILSTVIAILLVVFFIWLGITFPINLPFSLAVSKIVWLCILFVYAFVASLLPVWLLLQPRDYISSVNLFLFLILGIVAVFLVSPMINAPATIPFDITKIPIWPILFITVACGAASGFHALVASGTTSKQLDKEKDARFVGYGGMIAEGIVATLVLIFVSAGLLWRPNINLAGSFQNALSQGWIVAFSSGFSNIVHQAFPLISASLLIVLGSLIVNIFILTSLDTSSRVGRMISSEVLPEKSKLKNKALLTLIILIPAFLLAITNSYSTIWRMFGSANQLIAAVVLIVVSAYLSERKKPIIYTMIPAIFMILTTIAALIIGILTYISEGNISLIIISCILIFFAFFVFISTILKIARKRK